MSEIEHEHSDDKDKNEQAAEETDKKPKKKRRFRWLSVFLGILLIIAVSFQLAVKYYSDVIIKRLLQQAVTLKSEGMYSLDFEEGSFSFFEQEFEIKNLSFTLNEARWQQLKASGVDYRLLYEFNVPETSLSAGSLKEAWFSKSWTIEHFYISNPTVKIRENKVVGGQIRENVNTDLYFIISGYLKEFMVADFKLQKATIAFTDTLDNTYELKEIDVDIEGFKVDSTSQMADGKPFYVENIACKIGENSLKFPKNDLTLKFDQIDASVSGEYLNVKGFQTSSITYDSLGRAAQNVAFNDFSVEGLDFGQLYFDSVLQAKNIVLKKPFIDISKAIVGGNTTIENQFSYKSVRKFVKSVIIGEILLDSAALYVNTPKTDIAIDDFTLQLDNIWFDENSWNKRKRRFFVDDFDIKLRNYIADLPDKIHQLKALELGLSSKRNYAYCNNALITPVNENLSVSQLYELDRDKLMNFYLSRIELTGLDIWRAYLQKELRMATFRVNRPRVEINHFINIEEEMNRLLLSDSIDQILQDMQIDSLYLDTLELNELNQLDEDTLLEAKSEILESDSILPEDVLEMTNRFNATDDLPIEIFTDTLKNITFTTFLLNYFDSAYAARDDSLRYLAITDSLNSIDRDSLLLADISGLVNQAFEQVDINTIDINEAQFNYFHCDADTTERIAINNATIDLESFRISTENYQDSSRLFFSKEMEISADQIAYYLPDSIHLITARNFRISSNDSLISAKEAWYRPADRNRNFIVENIKDHNAIYDIRLNAIDITGLDFREIFREQVFIIEQLSITKPNILHFIPSIDPNEFNNEVVIEDKDILQYDKEVPIWTPEISDYIKVFEIKEINLNQGFYSLAKVTERTREVLSARDLQLCVREMELDSIELSNNNVLPLAADAELLANNYFINLPDSIHTLQSTSLGVSYSSSSVYFYNTIIKPSAVGRRKKGVNKYELNIPEFRLDGIDWQRLYFDKEFYVRELLINDPEALVKTVYDQKAAGAKTTEEQVEDELQLKLSEQIHESVLILLNGLEIDRLNINRAIFNWQQFNANNLLRQNARTDRLDLEVNTFRVDSTISPIPDRFMFANDIQVNARNYIHELPDKWHTIRSSKVEFSSASSTLFASYLHYAPKNWADIDFLLANNERKNLTEVYTPLLKINGTDLSQLFSDNTLLVENIELEEPKFRLVLHPKGERLPPNERFSTEKLDSLLRNTFREVQVKNLGFENASLQMGVHPLNTESTFFELDNAFLNIDNFNNLYQSYDSTRFMLADDIHIGVKDYRLSLPDSIYQFEAKEIGVRTGDPKVYIRDLDVKPRVSKKAIAEIFGNEIDWIHLKADSIILADFQFVDFLKNTDLVADRLDIESLDTYVYRDKRPPAAFGKRPPLPQEFLRNFNTYIKLDTVNLYNSKLTYEELAVDGKQPGQIYFEDLNAYAFNITNDTALLEDGAAVQLFANGFLMGDGLIEAAFTFPIANENNSFTFQGSLAPMDLRAINPMLENVASLKVNSGNARRLTFEVQADEEYADGFMRFYYRDLNVALLKRDAKPKKSGKIKSLLTMFANVLVKSKNPRFLFVKRGRIYTERDKSKSIFNYWAKTLLSGVKHSVGFSYEKPPKERRKTVFQFWKRRRKDFRRKNLNRE